MVMAVAVMVVLVMTDVVHCDGQSYTVMGSGPRGPNGIAMSPDAQ